MLRRALALAIGAVALNLASPAARAQTPIAEADFDATFPSFGYSYDYSGRGDPVAGNVDTSAETSSVFDVNTPPAATATMDSSQWIIPPDATYTYAGWGLGIGFVLPGSVALASGNLADYSVTFDVKVAGYDPLDDGLNLDLQFIFQAPDDDDEDTNAEHYTLIGTTGGLGLPPATTTTATITINPADLALTASEYDFPTAFGDTYILIVQAQPNVNQGEIGSDADNVITIDNVRFNGPTVNPLGGDFDGDLDVDGDDFLIWQRGESPNGLFTGDYESWKASFGQTPEAAAAAGAVPEPASLALGGAAALGLLARRRGRR